MSHISYVNGRYLPHAEAAVHIEDRGYQFSDGVYEVIAIYQDILLDGLPHLERLERSLSALSTPMPMSIRSMQCIIKELLRQNGRKDGCVYIQVTRGVAKRNHPFPKTVRPSLVMTLSPPKRPLPGEREHGVRVITRPDIRWGRKDIKSISLLPNILAKQDAVEAAAKEAWFINDKGIVTEGSSTNSYIVTRDNSVITHPLNEDILGGITRASVLCLAREKNVTLEERCFSLDEAKQAAEAFLTSTTLGVLPVVQIDDTVISNGHPGQVTQQLMGFYDCYVKTCCGIKGSTNPFLLRCS